MIMNTYFLTKQKELIQVNVLEETHYKRKIEILEGESKGKVRNVHPKGVAWGTMYPRIFTSLNKPSKVFVHKGRSLISEYELKENDKNAIPLESDYQFQPFVTDIIDCIHEKENVLLTGGTGVGKTTHILQLAARINQPVLRINFNGETRMADLIGKMTVLNGETIWVDGVLPTAMRKGYWIIFDEIDFADPAVLSLLHPVLEQNPILTLKENGGEIIKPHHLFRVFATSNSIGAMSERASSYSGTNIMNEAFLDRWHVIMVNNLSVKDEIKVIKSEVPGLAMSVAKKMVSFSNEVRNQSLQDAIYSGDNFSTRKLIAWAKKTALHRSAIIGAKKSWVDKLPQSEQESMNKVLELYFGNRRNMKKRIVKKAKSKAKPKLVAQNLTGTNG